VTCDGPPCDWGSGHHVSPIRPQPVSEQPSLLLIVAFIAGLITRELSLPATSHARSKPASRTLPNYTEWEDPKGTSTYANATVATNSSAGTRAPGDASGSGADGASDSGAPGADAGGTAGDSLQTEGAGGKWGGKRG